MTSVHREHPPIAMAAPASMSRNRWVLARFVIPIALFLMSAAINLDHVDITVFHPDESRWINRAHYATDLLEPFGPAWQDQYLTRGQPPLGSYLTGFGLLLQGRDTSTNGVWDFAYGADWNRAVGAAPSNDDLRTARRTNSILGAGTVVLAYFIGCALLGTVAGIAGAVMLALHPLQIWISSQALSDELLIFLIAATLLVIIRMCRQPTRGTAVALGILFGLGGATKLSPLLLTLPLALYGAILVTFAQTSFLRAFPARRIGTLLVWQPAIALITFVIAYPYLWPEPIQRTWNLFALRSQEMDEQASAWPGTAVDNPITAIARIYDRLTWQFSMTGDVVQTLGTWLGQDIDPWGVDIPLAVIGAGILVMLCLRRGLASGTMLAALLLAGQVATIIVGMKVDFYRYHLPVAFAVCLCTGITVGWAWNFLVARSFFRNDEATRSGIDLQDASAATTNRQPLQTGGHQ